MQLAFVLSMPGCPSWNGKWSGEGKKYAVVRSFTTKSGIAKAEQILAKGHYSYSWDDGWRAAITVMQVNSSQAARLRRESSGFCGYDWMIDTIISHGRPLADHQIPKAETATESPA